MTVDQLIEKLQDLKEKSPHSGLAGVYLWHHDQCWELDLSLDCTQDIQVEMGDLYREPCRNCGHPK